MLLKYREDEGRTQGTEKTIIALERKMQMSKNLRTLPHLSILALLLLILLTACGSGSSTATSGGSSTTASTPTQADNSTKSSGGYGSGGSKTTPTTAITGPTKTVTIVSGSNGFAFSPTTLTIAVGTTVIWNNTTGTVHTVTSNDGKSFDSGTSNPIASSGSFSFKFTKVGTYAYHCQFHSSMMGTVIVKAA